MEITINKKVFVSAYLPVVIDYARSQVKVNGRLISPKVKFPNVPAESTMFDLSYLLYSFCNIYQKDLFPENYMLGENVVYYTSRFQRIFDILNKKYYKEGKADDILTLSKFIPRKKYENCLTKKIDLDLPSHRKRVEYLKAQRRQDEIGEIIFYNQTNNDLNNEYLDLVIKYDLPLTYPGENKIIEKIPRDPRFIREISEIINSYATKDPLWE